MMRIRDPRLAVLLPVIAAGCLDIDSLHSAARDCAACGVRDAGCCAADGGACTDEFSSVGESFICLDRSPAHCGRAGEPCCPRGECELQGCCYDGICWASGVLVSMTVVPDAGSGLPVYCDGGGMRWSTPGPQCGSAGISCCKRADRRRMCSAGDTACVGDTCVRCGGTREPCCPGGACAAGCCALGPDGRSLCIAEGEACGPSDFKCRAGGACTGPERALCGGAGAQPFVVGTTPFCTQAWTVVDGDRCGTCGHEGEPPCASRSCPPDASVCLAIDCGPALRFDGSTCVRVK